MVNSLNCIEDSFITTDHVGGNRVYQATTPILLKGCQYRFVINKYLGQYLTNVHIDGRNSDTEDWQQVIWVGDSRDIIFQSMDDFKQIRVFWNKSQTEQNVEIGYWMRPDNSITT